MPQKCYYKPNRSHARLYSREDAARIVCRVLEQATAGPEGLDRRITSFPRGKNLTARVNFDMDLQDILDRIDRKCGAKTGFTTQQAASAVAVAASAQDILRTEAIATLELGTSELRRDQVLWISLLEFFAALLTFLTIITSVLRFVPLPPVRLAAQGAGFIIKRIAGFQTAIIARRAANDTSWIQMQRVLDMLKKAA